MKSLLLCGWVCAGLSLGAGNGARAEVVRPAPEFTFGSATSSSVSLKSLRGQSVVLLVADSASSSDFKKQVRALEAIYQQFAGKQILFVAALEKSEGLVASNIPFVLANHPEAVASAYGLTGKGFRLAIIGQDGNLDYQSAKVSSGDRVRDVLQNSFGVQAPARK